MSKVKPLCYLTMPEQADQICGFPAPKLDDSTRYDPKIHAQIPTFSEKVTAAKTWSTNKIEIPYAPYWFNQTI